MSELPSSLGSAKFFRTRDLHAAGMNGRTIARAVEDGLLVRPALGSDGPEQGIYTTPDAEFDPDHDEALVMFIFGGKALFGMQYAAMKHGLTTSLSPRMEIFAPYGMVLGERSYLKVYRTRREEALTVGVEEISTDLGVPIRMTSKARTVVDLMRQMDRNSDDWRHAIDALHTFIGEGGDPSEIAEIASHFEKWLPPVVEAAIHSYVPGGYTR